MDQQIIVPNVRPAWGVASAIRCSPLTLTRIALGVFLLSLITRTTADADLWGHLRFGLDTLSSGGVHASDPYSFTSDVPWINHEWLAELIMAIAYTGLGALGLNLLKVACIAVVATVMVTVAREEKGTPWARDLFLALVVFSVYTRMQAVRPQIFSVALFSVLLYVLRRADMGRPRALWGVPLLFAAWVNLHGGWLVGLGTLAVWLAGAWFRKNALRERVAIVAIGAGSVLATLVNPYGTGLWRFLATTVGLERPDVTDWKPLLDLPTPVIAIETILPGVAILCLARARFRMPLPYLAIVAMLVLATFRIGRTDAFAHAAIGVLMAPQVIGGLMAVERRLLAFRPQICRASAPVGLVAICLAATTAATTGRELRTIPIAGPWVPDPGSLVFLRDAYPGTRVLTWFDWGEYAVWHLSPTGARVSMDGRRETVYSARVLAEHFAFYRGEPGTADYPDRISAEVVWLPSGFPNIGPLTERGWVRVFESPGSVVLARRTVKPPQRHDVRARRIFPGP